MDYDMSHQIDSTLIKMALNTVQDGDLDNIKQNIEKYHLNMNLLIDKENQQNAFFYCALVKDDLNALNICKFLVELKVNSHFRDKHDQTCLYYTVREGKYNTSEYLIKQCNLPVNEKDIYGQNPIYYAAREGHLELCKLLVENGTDINLEDKYGQTCIFYAIRQGHYEIVDFLIKNGANVNKTDKKKQTPVSYAMRIGQNNIVELLVANGGIKPEHKTKNNKEHSKKNNIKSEEEIKQSKIDMINSIQVPKKYILVKVGPNGEKTPLSEEELKEFALKNENIMNIVNNKELLKKMVDDVTDEEMKLVDSWESIAKKIMNILWKCKDAEWFQKPVDVVELNIPDYNKIITNPMDFSTIKKKLNSNSYTNVKGFVNDINLVFQNCRTYNGENSILGGIATRIQKEYERLFVEMKLDKFL